MPACSYADHVGGNGDVRCVGPTAFTAHDRRGCRDVCYAHAAWLIGRWILDGHSRDCPMSPDTAENVEIMLEDTDLVADEDLLPSSADALK